MEKTKNALSKNRIPWIDNAKAFAMLFIVLGHTLADGKVYFYLYSFHVILFFFLSGLTFSSRKKPWEFIWGKFKGIMIPYYIFSAISIVIYLFIGNYAEKASGRAESSLNLRDCIIGMFFANRSNGMMKWNTSLWFLPCLFCLLLVFYLIDKIILKSKKPVAYIITLICLTALMLTNMIWLKLINLPFGIETVINVSPFFMAGICISRFKLYLRLNERIKPLIRALIAIIFIAAGFWISLKNGAVDIAKSHFGNSIWLYFVTAILGVAGWSLISGLFENKVFSYVGSNTMPILLMHKFPIMFILTVFTKFTPEGNVFICLPIAAAVMAMCLGVGWLIEKIFPFVIGKSKKLT
jgi:acyltransferase